MLWKADTFLAQVDLLRTVAITGAKGTGKDLLAFELSQVYLEKGYKFASNQRSVWNDPLYNIERLTPEQWQQETARYQVDQKGVYEIVERKELSGFLSLVFGDDQKVTKRRDLTDKDIYEFTQIYGKDDQGFYRRVPDVFHRAMVITEGGRYLRKWVYFENMYEFTRKTDNYIFIPSIRLPHVDLCELVCINVFPFKFITGRPGGVFYWYVGGSGISKPISGWFVHFPKDIGIYDTKDFSTSPTEVIEWFTRQIDDTQRNQYGRDGLSQMASGSSSDEQDSIANYARQIERASLSLQNKRR